jgi:FkbM family methyltransferase
VISSKKLVANSPKNKNMKIKKIIKEKVHGWPYSLALSMYWLVNKRKKNRIIYPHGNHWKIKNIGVKKESYCTPDAKSGYKRGSNQMRKIKLKRYTLNNYVEIEKNDTVVDVGAFVGEFSSPASEVASRVISIEPSPVSASCLRHNAKKENVLVVEKAISEVEKKVEFKIGKDLSDSSFINVDSKEVEKIEKVESVKLSSLMHEIGVEKIDFLKVDGEGAEPEIIRSAENIRISKCAIDCTKERNEKSTKKSIINELKKRSMEIKVGGPENMIVFGRKSIS